MKYELDHMEKVQSLFAGWEETLITSCLQKVMGKIYVTDLENSKSAMAFVGCFAFYAGEPDRELVSDKPDGFVIMTPQNEAWSKLIEDCYPKAKKVTRYGIKKDTRFDVRYLRDQSIRISNEFEFAGYELKPIDAKLYDLCMQNPATMDFVSAFGSKERYLKLGRGYVILKNGKIVSGASSYTRYREGIEIEVDTIPEERRKGLATICCSTLILKCLEEGLYPSWDAHSMNSVHLAEKFGYELDHEYVAYEVSSEFRTH